MNGQAQSAGTLHLVRSHSGVTAVLDDPTFVVPAAEPAEAPPYRWRWIVLGIVLIAEIMDLLDSTVITIAAPTVRAELGVARGRHYWRSLEELTRRPGFEAMLARELPRQAASLLDAVDRRQFLQLMGASLALAGLSTLKLR